MNGEIGRICGPIEYDAEGVGLAREVANALLHNSTLTLLDLDHSFIGDDGATHLAAALAHNTSLQSLYLENNNIFRAGTLAIGRALKRSPLREIEWRNFVDEDECSLGKLWKELGLPPIARTQDWTDQAVVFFRRVRAQQHHDTEKRLAFAMGLHPRLGSNSAARMLDHSFVDYIHELVASSLVVLYDMHDMPQEKRDEHDCIARF